MRRLTQLSAVAVVAVFALSGCGSDSKTDGGTTSASKDVCKTAKGDGPKIGLAYDVGGRGDQSFNDSAYAGLEKSVSEFSATCVEGEAPMVRPSPLAKTACARWPTVARQP